MMIVTRLKKSLAGSRRLRQWREETNRAAWERHREAPLPVPTGMAGVLRDLRRDGIAIFPLARLGNGAALLDGLRDEFRTGLAAKAPEIEARQKSLLLPHDGADGQKDYIVQFRPWEGAPRYDTALGRLALHPDIVSVVNVYFGLYSKAMTISYWDTLISGPDASARSSQQWHRDYEDVQVIKAFVYLSDVNGGNGPFQYVRKTHAGNHRWTDPKTWRDSEGGIRASEEDLFGVFPKRHASVIQGPVGTMFIVDTKGYHKGGLAVERTRELAFTSYKSPSFKQKGQPAPFEGLPEDVHPAIHFAAQP